MGTAPSMTIEENLSLAYLRGGRTGAWRLPPAGKMQPFSGKSPGAGSGAGGPAENPGRPPPQAVRGRPLPCPWPPYPPRSCCCWTSIPRFDPATADKVLALTRKIVRKNTITTLMITHNIQSALDCGDRTLMMQQERSSWGPFREKNGNV